MATTNPVLLNVKNITRDDLIPPLEHAKYKRFTFRLNNLSDSASNRWTTDFHCYGPGFDDPEENVYIVCIYTGDVVYNKPTEGKQGGPPNPLPCVGSFDTGDFQAFTPWGFDMQVTFPVTVEVKERTINIPDQDRKDRNCYETVITETLKSGATVEYHDRFTVPTCFTFASDRTGEGVFGVTGTINYDGSPNRSDYSSFRWGFTFELPAERMYEIDLVSTPIYKPDEYEKQKEKKQTECLDLRWPQA